MTRIRAEKVERQAQSRPVVNAKLPGDLSSRRWRSQAEINLTVDAVKFDGDPSDFKVPEATAEHFRMALDGNSDLRQLQGSF